MNSNSGASKPTSTSSVKKSKSSTDLRSSSSDSAKSEDSVDTNISDTSSSGSSFVHKVASVNMSYVPTDNDGNPLKGDALVGALFTVLDMQAKQIGEFSSKLNAVSHETSQAAARINDWDARLSQIERGTSSGSQSFSKVSFSKSSQNGWSGNDHMDTTSTSVNTKGPDFNYKEMAEYLEKQMALGLIASTMSPAIRLEVIKTLNLFESIDHLLPRAK